MSKPTSDRAWARRCNKLARLRADPNRDFYEVCLALEKLGNVSDIPNSFLAFVDDEMFQLDTRNAIEDEILGDFQKEVSAEVYKRCMAMRDEDD